MAKKTIQLGALPHQTDVRDYTLDVDSSEVKFPKTFKLDTPRIKNQGAVGSCVAHSIAEVIEYHNKKQETTDELMSTGFIYGNRRNTSNKKAGMYVRDALANACKYGDVTKADFPQNVEVPEAITLFENCFETFKTIAYPNRISTYFKVKSIDDIKYALMNYGPVVFAVDWRADAFVDLGGILQLDPKKKKVGGHCMIIYGWNENGWRIQNSWGSSWGNSGRAILPFTTKLSEAWGVTDEVSSATPDVKKPFHNTTFLRWLAKVINWFANLFKKKR